MSVYCPDVYKGLYIRKVQNSQVAVGFCCVNSTQTVDHDQVSVTLSTKRISYLSTSKDPQCGSCWRNEKFLGQSRRTQSIRWYKENATVDQQIQLTTLDYNTKNICNLACVTCGPSYSSRWISEINHHDWTDDSDRGSLKNDTTWQHDIDPSQLKKIYFNGGEPLLTHDHLEVMRWAQLHGSLENCEIAYNTNGTILPSSQCLDLWKQARLIRLFLSIDGIGLRFEFARWPAKWQQMLDFIDFINALDFNVILDITCTVGIHNVFYLDEIIAWHRDHCAVNAQGDPVNLTLQLCSPWSQGGKLLSLSGASPSLMTEISEYLSKIDHSSVKELNNSITSRGIDDDLWIDYLNSLSLRRKCDWRQMLPKLSDIISKYHPR